MIRTAAATLMLLAATAATAGEAPKPDKTKVAQTRDTVVCKRFAETGSLVASHKVCKSKADWDRERDLVRDGFTPANSCRTPGSGTNCTN